MSRYLLDRWHAWDRGEWTYETFMRDMNGWANRVYAATKPAPATGARRG